MRKSLIPFVAIALVLAGGVVFANRGIIRLRLADLTRPALPPAQPYQPQPEPAAPTDGEPAGPAEAPKQEPEPAPAKEPAPSPAPSSAGANLAVPFTPQAPHADWDHLHEEACEETALIMVHAYLTNAGAFTPDEAERQIQAMVKWSVDRFGYFEDQTAEEIAIIAREYYGHAGSYAAPLKSMDDVKKLIDQGRPVIIPSAGRMLGNPYFSGEGPLYHAIVVKGYTKDGKIITNDAGTRRGADYLYDADVLFAAAHDWNGGDVAHGAKMMVVVKE